MYNNKLIGDTYQKKTIVIILGVLFGSILVVYLFRLSKMKIEDMNEIREQPSFIAPYDPKNNAGVLPGPLPEGYWMPVGSNNKIIEGVNKESGLPVNKIEDYSAKLPGSFSTGNVRSGASVSHIVARSIQREATSTTRVFQNFNPTVPNF